MNPRHLALLERFAWGSGVTQDELAEAFGLEPLDLEPILPLLVGPTDPWTQRGEGCQRVGDGNRVEVDIATPWRFLNALWQVVLGVHVMTAAPPITELLGRAREVGDSYRALDAAALRGL